MSISENSEPWIFPLDSKGLGSRSAKGFLVTVVAQGAKTVLTGVSAIALSRLLKATDFGLLALIAPVTGLLGLLSNIGLFQAIVQSEKITRSQITSLFWISFIIGSVVAVLFLGIAPVMAYVFNNKKITIVTIVLSSTILMSSLASVHIAILNRLMDFRSLAVIETLSLFFTTITSIGFALAGLGYWALVYGQVVGAVSNLALAWILSPWKPSSLTVRIPEVSGMLAFGRNLTVSNVAVYLNTSVDNMIVGYRLGEHSLGLYDRAWKLGVMPLNQLLAPVARIALPTLSRLVGDETRYRRHFKAMLELMLLVSGPGLIAAIFSASVVVPGLLGERWRDLAPVFQWLCIGGVISPVNGAAFWLFISQGRSEEQIFYMVGAIFINIISYIFGVFWGLEGVARTSAISVYLLQFPFLVYGACKKGPVTKQYFFKALKTPLIASITAIISCALFWSLLKPTTFLQISGLFFQAYFVSFITLLSSANGRAMIADVRNVFTTAFTRK